MQERNIINVFGDVGQQCADGLTALAVLVEFPAWFDDSPARFVPASTERFHVNGLAVHADHFRLLVKRVDVAGTAIHKQEDDRLRFGGKVRRLWRQRVLELDVTTRITRSGA